MSKDRKYSRIKISNGMGSVTQDVLTSDLKSGRIWREDELDEVRRTNPLAQKLRDLERRQGALTKPVVVQPKKEIGSRVADIGPGNKEYNVKTDQAWDDQRGMSEDWSQKYKNSINCSHPKGFSQKAHCAGKKKHNESIEMTCPDCGMCQTHGNLSEIKKGQKDSNGYTKCWPGKHAEGTKKSSVTGKQVRNCVPNEGIEESRLYYNVIGTRDKDLKESFGMQQDQKGWFLEATAGRKRILEAHKAFGAPTIL
jgi:hypothetical protein